MTPRVKICCIADEAEAALAISFGAAAIGLVGRMQLQVGSRRIDTALIVGTHATDRRPFRVGQCSGLIGEIGQPAKDALVGDG